MMDVWEWFSKHHEEVTALVAVLGAIGGMVTWIYTVRRDRKDAPLSSRAPPIPDVPTISASTIHKYESPVTINNYYGAQKEIERRQWRKLERVQYLVLENTVRWQERVCADIALALRDSFGTTPYVHLDLLVQFGTLANEGTEYLGYVFHTHRANFAAAFRTRIKKRYRFHDLRLEGDEADAAEAKFNNEIASVMKGWTIEALPFPTKGTLALGVTYDSESNTITIDPRQDYSLDPADYPDKLETTSELIRFIASSYNSTIGFLGDLAWSSRNVQIYKLVNSLLERDPIDLDRVRVDVSDPERWDYSYPKVEAEILQWRGRESQP